MDLIEGIVFVVLMIATPAQADGFKDLAAARAFADQAMQLISQGKIEDAFGTLKPYWPIPPTEVQQVALQMKNQLNQLGTTGGRFGTPLGFEFVGQQAVGKSFAQLVYFQKFSFHAFTWRFTFYRPDTEWLVNMIVIADDSTKLFTCFDGTSK